MASVGVAEDLVVGRGHVGVAEQVLAEDLAAFQLGGGLAGAEDPQPGVLEGIDDAGGQRGLGPDDRQADLVLLGELDQGGKVVDGDGDVLAVEGRAGVARGHEHAVRAGTLGDLPGQGVLRRRCRRSERSC